MVRRTLDHDHASASARASGFTTFSNVGTDVRDPAVRHWLPPQDITRTCRALGEPLLGPAAIRRLVGRWRRLDLSGRQVAQLQHRIARASAVSAASCFALLGAVTTVVAGSVGALELELVFALDPLQAAKSRPAATSAT